MTKRTIHAGKTVTEDGSLQQGDTLDIQGGASGGAAGGTAIVDTSLMNAGNIIVFGGFPGSQPGDAGGQGGLLDVTGVLTDLGSILIHGGRYMQTGNAQGLGGTLSVSGTLSVAKGGTVRVDGGSGASFTGAPAGIAGAVDNTGSIDNDGVMTFAGGGAGHAAGEFGSGRGGAGAALSNSGTIVNQGKLILQGGQGASSYDDPGRGAKLVDKSMLTNSGHLDIQGGGGSRVGGYGGSGGLGGKLTVTSSGVMTNAGSITIDGGAATLLYRYGHGGQGGVLLDQGSMANSGSIEIGAGVDAPTYTENGGYGAQLTVAGTLTSTGTVLVDGGTIGNATGAQATGGTLTVDGVMTSSGALTVDAGGNGRIYINLNNFYYSPNALSGVMAISGYFSNSGVMSIQGGGAAAGIYGRGSLGGTVTAGSASTVLNQGTLTIGGGSGASFIGYDGGSGAGQGGVLTLGAGITNTGSILIGGGTGGSGGGLGGGGGAIDVSGYLRQKGLMTIGAGIGGGASGTLTIETNSRAEIYTTLENDGVLVMKAGSLVDDPFNSGSMLRNTGTITGSGEIFINLVNDGVVDVTGQLFIYDHSIVSDGPPGLFQVENGAVLLLNGDSIDASQSVILAGPGAALSATTDDAGVLVSSPQGGILNILSYGYPGYSAVLNVADTNLSVFLPTAANLTLSKMTAIAATGSSGNDTITALSSGQTLTGGLGTDMLAGAAATGDLFRDVAAGLNGDTIAGFAGTDLIDITDIAPGSGLDLSYTQHGSAGSLVVTNGSVSSTITLQGHFTTASFATASDLQGGVLISLHG